MATNANANGIPFLKRTGIPPAIKNSMVVYYDIKKQGCTNENMKANPVLKDFSGNGNDGYCNNFAWNNESGIGDFVFKDFTISNKDNVNIKENIITINISVDNDDIGIGNIYSQAKYDTPATKIRVSGIKETIYGVYWYRDSEGNEYSIKITKDGNYNLPKSYNTIEGTGNFNALKFYNPDKIETVVTIEQLDYYKDAICTDGVDDYIVRGLGIKVDNATVVFDVDWSIDTKYCGIRLKNIFSIHPRNSALAIFIKEPNNETIVPQSIIACSTDKKIYDNNLDIINHNVEPNPVEATGVLNISGNSVSAFTKMYIRRIAVFNRVLTADEIKYVYEKIFGCKLKTMEERVEDSIILHYDVAKQGATNESMKTDPRLIDLSGHGYDAKLNNFAWKGSSGIGKYSVDWADSNTYKNYLNDRFTGSVSYNKIVINYNNSYSGLVETKAIENTVPSYKVKVSGIQEGMILKYGYDGDGLFMDITKDGEYTLPEYTGAYIGFRLNKAYNNINVVIEQIPEYLNALVFDGVNDYGIVEDIPMFMPEVGFTVIAKRKILNTDNYCVASCSPGYTKGAFLFELGSVGDTDSQTSLYPNTAIYSFGKGIHTAALQSNDLSYMKSSQYNDIILTKGINNSTAPLVIGRRTATDNRILKGVIYSFMLFNRDLTTEEIEFVKQKYFSD